MNDYYRGRWCWIFGGSQGIGKALAEQLQRRGAKLLLVARQRDSLQAQAERLGAAWHCADVGQAQQVEEQVAQGLAQYGPPQLLFNCAGLALPGYLEDLTLDDAETMLRVNYLGTLYTCKALLPALIAQGSGHIVNFSSLAGVMGLFGYTAYCGSKYAVMGFSEALRRESKIHGLRVSVCCPPNTRTPGLEQENLRKPPEVLAQEEKVKVLEPEAVASYVLEKLPNNPFTLIPSFDGRLAHRLARHAPGLLDWFLQRPRPSS